MNGNEESVTSVRDQIIHDMRTTLPEVTDQRVRLQSVLSIIRATGDISEFSTARNIINGMHDANEKHRALQNLLFEINHIEYKNSNSSSYDSDIAVHDDEYLA